MLGLSVCFSVEIRCSDKMLRYILHSIYMSMYAMHVRYVEQGDDLPEKRSCRDGTRSRSGDLEASVSVADISPSNDTFTSFTKIKKKNHWIGMSNSLIRTVQWKTI